MLETGRLTLRDVTPGDLEALTAVLGDPVAIRYYPAPFTRAQVDAWIRWNLKNYADHGYGLWAVVLKASGDCIGDCGLTWQLVGYSAERQLEVGWHIRRDLWNQGLATEAGIASRDYARDVLRSPRLISIISPDNLASQAVARKLGMEIERDDMLDGHRRLIFAMNLTASQPWTRPRLPQKGAGAREQYQINTGEQKAHQASDHEGSDEARGGQEEDQEQNCSGAAQDGRKSQDHAGESQEQNPVDAPS